MKACIYARTSHQDKSHHRTTLDNQIAFCRELATQHNLTVTPEHIFTDIDLDGDLAPSCWAGDGEGERPALSILLNAIADGQFQRVIVHRMERLGTTSEVLVNLTEYFKYHEVMIVASPERIGQPDDATEAFAISLLKPLILCDTELDRQRKQQAMNRKLEEISRLQAKIERLEADVSELLSSC